MLMTVLMAAVLVVCLVACTGEVQEKAPLNPTTEEEILPITATGYDAGVIPEELEYIPEGYRNPAEHQGALELLEYTTYDSFNYGVAGHELEKVAWVYVPYSYDPSQPYDIVYLSHGGWSNETTLMGTSDAPTGFKNIIDHAIEDGLIRPIIMVMPTYNNLSPSDSGDYGLALQLTDNFHNEFANDLMPAAESAYSTYAMGDVSSEGLLASRDHRAFAGFSMGSVNTWHTFQYCLPYIRYFNPMSGGGLSGAAAAQIATVQGFGPRDFFIFTATGTEDFAYSGFRSGVLAMPGDSGGFFELADSQDAGNLSYRERAGYTHDYRAADEYTYNALRFFFNGTYGGEDSAEQEPFSVDTPIADIIADPAFGSWGRLILPAQQGYWSGDRLGNLSLTWYSGIDPQMTVAICNYLHDAAVSGETVFLDLYSEAEKAADPRRDDTGLFFFRGEPGAPTAIICAGGGFSYVGAMHDSFPHALELSRRGINAFAIIYRPGAQTACENLARAIALLHEHADELGISMEGYSLWGGSAGGRMAAWLGSYGTEAFGEAAYPRSAACVVNYTGLSEVTGAEPPTYSAVGTQDYIASWYIMQRRIEAIRANGTPAMIEVFDGLGHGFGLGTGTIAEGWIDNAIAFWMEQVE